MTARDGVRRRRSSSTRSGRPRSAGGLLGPGDHVLVGVSGGPDSVALLHALMLLRSELRAPAHRLPRPSRPPARGGPGCGVRRGARRPPGLHRARSSASRCHGAGGGPPRKPRGSSATRRWRVSREAVGARRIALGHTADDQAETVLMRVLQGAGPRGLAGIPARRGRIVRPLLDVDRAAVVAHLAAHGLEAVDDSTNRDPRFLRNRVRHEILPLLAAQVGAHVPRALRRMARASREAVEALDALVRGRLARSPHGHAGGLASRARRVRRSPAGGGEGGGAPGPRRGRGARAPRQRAARGAPRRPRGTSPRRARGAGPPARRRRGRARPGRAVAPRAGAAPAPTPLTVPGQAPAGGLCEVRAAIEAVPSRQPADPAREAWFDAEALGLGPRAGAPPPAATLLVRPRRSGEQHGPVRRSGAGAAHRPPGRGGRPRLARTRWPVLVDVGGAGPGEVLWLVGIRRAAAAPVTGATRLMLRLQAETAPLAFGPAPPYDTAPLPPGAAGIRTDPFAVGGPGVHAPAPHLVV